MKITVAKACLLLSAVISMGGCASNPVTEPKIPIPSEKPQLAVAGLGYRIDEQPLIDIKSSEWGLSFSGGGFRAATFAIGVAKALYDSHQLHRFGVISIVSGGSYAGAWLYAPRTPGSEFGSGVLAPEKFANSVCTLDVTGNFTSYGAMLKAPFLGKSPVTLYEESLSRTFTGDINASVSDFGAQIARHESPYLIFNATIRKPKADTWMNTLLEITPFGIASPLYGVIPWDHSNKPPKLNKAVAISGAAVPFALDQDYPLNAAGRTTTLTLSDGGYSENLGAIALIRRGVRNIVVVDSEHDPLYSFGAYRRLKDGVKELGLRIFSPVLDQHLDLVENGGPIPGDSEALSKSYQIAKVYGPAKDGKSMALISTIYYVKMSVPRSIYGQLSDASAQLSGEQIATSFYTEMKKDPLPNKDWDCARAELKIENVRDWAIYSVQTYMDSPASHTYLAKKFNGLDYNFPQMTTLDQSYYIDQTSAVIGLGYLEGAELSGLLRGI